jgi:uncharacterized membrane protein YgdD (TMEM256/DUF423 family)
MHALVAPRAAACDKPASGNASDAMPIAPWILAAALMGAAGVTLSAAAAHGATGIRLDQAGYLLLFHAPAVIAGALALEGAALWRPLGLAALAGFVLGSVLFAGDLSLRAFAGIRLFPMAAPAGGTLLILGWLVLAAAAIVMMARAR